MSVCHSSLPVNRKGLPVGYRHTDNLPGTVVKPDADAK